MFGLKVIAFVLLVGAVAPSQATPYPADVAKSDGLLDLGGLLGGLVDLVDKVLGVVGKLLLSLIGKCKGDKPGIIGLINHVINLIRSLLKLLSCDGFVAFIFQVFCVVRYIFQSIFVKLGIAIYKILAGIFYLLLGCTGSQGVLVEYLTKYPGKPQICHIGFDKSCGLGPDIDDATCRKVIGEGVTDLQYHCDNLKDNYPKNGLLAVILKILEKILALGIKVKVSTYKCVIEDLLEIIHWPLAICFAIAKNYSLLDTIDDLLELLVKILSSIFVKIEWKLEIIKDYLTDCSGPGMHELKEYCY